MTHSALSRAAVPAHAAYSDDEGVLAACFEVMSPPHPHEQRLSTNRNDARFLGSNSGTRCTDALSRTRLAAD